MEFLRSKIGSCIWWFTIKLNTAGDEGLLTFIRRKNYLTIVIQ